MPFHPAGAAQLRGNPQLFLPCKPCFGWLVLFLHKIFGSAFVFYNHVIDFRVSIWHTYFNEYLYLTIIYTIHYGEYSLFYQKKNKFRAKCTEKNKLELFIFITVFYFE